MLAVVLAQTKRAIVDRVHQIAVNASEISKASSLAVPVVLVSSVRLAARDARVEPLSAFANVTFHFPPAWLHLEVYDERWQVAMLSFLVRTSATANLLSAPSANV